MTKEGPIESFNNKIDEFVVLIEASNAEDLFDVWKHYIS
jgi:sRNA-binding regulator protein Hfq